jgi:hypothetical protein
VAGDKYNRRVGAFDDDPSLKIKSIEVPERDVKHQAVWNDWPRPGKEFSSECECLGLPAFAANQRFQGFTYRGVVVNNEHYRLYGKRFKYVLGKVHDDCPPPCVGRTW